MSRGRRASFVVRVVEDRRGQVSGIVELVATGAKEAFTGVEAIGRVITRMLPGATSKGGKKMKTRRRVWTVMLALVVMGALAGAHAPSGAIFTTVTKSADLGVLLVKLVATFASTPAHAASTIVVPRDFPTIQAAVDAAAPGETINVERGTYTEEVVIGKDLNLRGTGVGATIIESPATLTPYAVNVRNGRPWTAIVRVGHGAHVRISGLTISGPVPCGTVSGVTAVQAATLELTDAAVRDIHPVTSTCEGPRDVGVQFGTPPWIEIDGMGGSTADGRVTHVAIDNFLSEGVEVVGPPDGQPSRVKLADNTITAGSPQLPTEQFGIVILFAAVAQITDNTISGGVCNFEGCGPDPIFEFQAMGIFIEEAGVGSTITNNHISGSEVGVYQYASPNCCTISGNRLQDNRFFGIVIQDSDGTTSENAITGGQVGIGVVAGGANTVGVLQGDKIKQTSVAPVKEFECCGFRATAIIKDH